MNSEDDILWISIYILKDDYALVFALIAMQDATENRHYPALTRKTIETRADFTFPPEHVTEVIVLGEQIRSHLTNLVLLER